jgi:hypothetical protein
MKLLFVATEPISLFLSCEDCLRPERRPLHSARKDGVDGEGTEAISQSRGSIWGLARPSPSLPVLCYIACISVILNKADVAAGPYVCPRVLLLVD